MSYVPPEPRLGAGTLGSNLDRAEEEIGREEAFAASQRLAREAEEATGGTPSEKLWRRVKSRLHRGDPPAPEGEAQG